MRRESELQLRNYVRAEMRKAIEAILTGLIFLIVIIYVYGIVMYWKDHGRPPIDLLESPDHYNFFSNVFIFLLCYFIAHVIHYSDFLEDLLALWADRQEKEHRTINWPYGILGAAFVYRCLGIWLAFWGAFIILLSLLVGWLIGFKLMLPLRPLIIYGLLTGYGSSLLLLIFEKIFRKDTIEPPDNVQLSLLIILYIFYPVLVAVFLLGINNWSVSAY